MSNDVVAFNPGDADHGQQPGADIGLYLARLRDDGLSQGEAHILAALAESGRATVGELHAGRGYENLDEHGVPAGAFIVLREAEAAEARAMLAELATPGLAARPSLRRSVMTMISVVAAASLISRVACRLLPGMSWSMRMTSGDVSRAMSSGPTWLQPTRFTLLISLGSMSRWALRLMKTRIARSPTTFLRRIQNGIATA